MASLGWLVLHGRRLGSRFLGSSGYPVPYGLGSWLEGGKSSSDLAGCDLSGNSRSFHVPGKSCGGLRAFGLRVDRIHLVLIPLHLLLKRKSSFGEFDGGLSLRTTLRSGRGGALGVGIGSGRLLALLLSPRFLVACVSFGWTLIATLATSVTVVPRLVSC